MRVWHEPTFFKQTAKLQFVNNNAGSPPVLQRPPMVSVVDHESCHTAVDADILPCDEPRHIRAEVQHHIGNIGRRTHPTCGLLGGVGALVDGVGKAP